MRTIILLLGFALLFGCIGQWQVIAEPTDGTAQVAGDATKIGYLYVYQQYGATEEDDWYDISFTLEDSKGNVVTESGSGKVTIVDEYGDKLFEKTFTVSEDQFDESEGYPFYSNPAYTVMAMFSDMNKTTAYYADVSVSFTTSNGDMMVAKEEIYVPYGLEEYNDYYDDDYEYLEPLEGSASTNGIEVSLVKGGLSTGYYQDYELDIDVKNTGSSKKEVTVRDATLVTNGKQYKDDYDIEIGTLYPQAAYSDYLYFYDVEELGTTATLYLEVLVIEGTNAKISEIKIDFNP